ncbi:hypothetical protein [Desulfovibrio piger]|nr:hypothetical protein [Desulfovibrio piger]
MNEKIPAEAGLKKHEAEAFTVGAFHQRREKGYEELLMIQTP